jgi:dephospho-CoA kinase
VITVGLTGGIATGKSAVSAILRDKPGVVLVDADQVSRDVCAVGTIGLGKVIDRFGSEFRSEDGTLDRRALGALVVDNKSAREDLEAILHPLIASSISERMVAARRSKSVMYVVEAALMVETGSYTQYDFLLVVTCKDEIQLRRLMRREGIDEQSARKWIGTQLPLVEKSALADHVIENNGDFKDLTQAVDLLFSKIIPN